MLPPASTRSGDHSAARPGRAHRAAPWRLAAVAAFYAAYLCAYFVLGPAAFSAQGYYWHDGLVIVLTGGLLAWAGWRSGPPMRAFLLCNAASLAALLVSDVTYSLDRNVWRDAQGGMLKLTDAAYTAFLFTTLIAWGGLALALAQRHRPSGRTVAVFGLLMVGFVALFAGFYTPLYRDTLSTLDGRLGVALAVLELAVVISGMAVMLLGASYALVLQVFGLTLLAASDMLYSADAVGPASFAGVDTVWMLGLCLLLAGAAVLPQAARHRPAAALDNAVASGVRRSGLSTLLLSLSLGAVLVSAMSAWRCGLAWMIHRRYRPALRRVRWPRANPSSTCCSSWRWWW